MIELLLDAIVSLGPNEMQNVLTSVGESAVKKFRESQAWKKLIVGTGEFFIKNEQEENSFFQFFLQKMLYHNRQKGIHDCQYRR